MVDAQSLHGELYSVDSTECTLLKAVVTETICGMLMLMLTHIFLHTKSSNIQQLCHDGCFQQCVEVFGFQQQ